ncbi:hypothetical protein CALCODRAFT_481829, partial [Calocera cornea HHB12733]
MSFPRHVHDSDEVRETYVQKGLRKCKEQPVVPVGVLLTTLAFLGATRSLRTGDKAAFNLYLRFRVLAQGLTVLGCVAGAYWVGRGARAEGRERAREAARRGEWAAASARREDPFGHGLGGRLREAERLTRLEEEADARLGSASAAADADPDPAAAAASPGPGKTSAEVNAALARARAKANADKRSRNRGGGGGGGGSGGGSGSGEAEAEVVHEPMRVRDLLDAGHLRE